MRLVLLAALLAAGPVQAAEPPEGWAKCVVASGDYLEKVAVGCVIGAAERLEPSKEPASDIAVAAVGVCSEKFNEYARLSNRCESGTASPAHIAQVKDIARQHAVQSVVLLRAGRMRPK